MRETFKGLRPGTEIRVRSGGKNGRGLVTRLFHSDNDAPSIEYRSAFNGNLYLVQLERVRGVRRRRKARAS
jgi:hypothetical protein